MKSLKRYYFDICKTVKALYLSSHQFVDDDHHSPQPYRYVRQLKNKKTFSVFPLDKMKSKVKTRLISWHPWWPAEVP